MIFRQLFEVEEIRCDIQVYVERTQVDAESTLLEDFSPHIYDLKIIAIHEPFDTNCLRVELDCSLEWYYENHPYADSWENDEN